MCDFFSLVTTDRHAIYYFNCKQRKNKIFDRRGNPLRPDSHASICSYYGLDEDTVNKYEWNPFTNKLILDTEQFDEDPVYILDHLNAQDWTPICGDLEGARKFIAGLNDVQWMKLDHNYGIPSGVKMFESRAAARAAARGGARNTAWNTANGATWYAAHAAARGDAWDTAWKSAYEAAWNAVWDSVYEVSWDAALYCVFTYILAGIEIPPHHTEHIRTRFELWLHGYGVACDVDGVLYCYKK